MPPPGNQHPLSGPWFPSAPHRLPSMLHRGNHTPPRAPWFPLTPPRLPSTAHHGNQVWREGGSGQLGTSGGQCRHGLTKPGPVTLPAIPADARPPGPPTASLLSPPYSLPQPSTKSRRLIRFPHFSPTTFYQKSKVNAEGSLGKGGRRGGGQFRRTAVRRNVGQRNRPGLFVARADTAHHPSGLSASALPAHPVSGICHRELSERGT